MYLSMLFSISWALEPHRGEWGLWDPGEVGDKGAPSISHWSLRDFLWSKAEKEDDCLLKRLKGIGYIEGYNKREKGATTFLFLINA